MANKRRFKPSRTAIGFRQRGEGLGAAVTRLQEQANREIQGLKDIQTQTQAQAKDYLNSLSDKYQNEADVRRIHHELEDEVDKHVIESARVRADQEIADAKNEAQRHRTEAEFWGEFSPTLSKNLTKLSVEGFKVADTIRGNALLNEFYATNSDLLTEELSGKAHSNLTEKINKAIETGRVPHGAASALIGKTTNNTHFSTTVVDDIIDNSQSWEEKCLAELQDILSSQGKELTSSNIQVLVNTWSYDLIGQLKIGRNTNAAKRLVQHFASMATNKRKNIIDSNRATETQQQLIDQLNIIHNSTSSAEQKQEAYRTWQNILGYTGTFRDDKGKYHQGGYNKAQAYVQLGTFAKNNLNFDTVEEYKDFLRSIKVSGTDQYMYERHTAHYNKLVKEYESHLIQDTEHKTKVAKLKDKIEVLEVSQKLIEMSKGKENDPDLMGEVYVEWYEKHVKNLSKEQQRKVLTQLGDFSEKDIDVLPVFIAIQEELKNPKPNKSAIMQMSARLALDDKSKFHRLTNLLENNPALKALDSDVNLNIAQIKKNITQLLRTNIKSLAYPQGEDELNNPEYIRVNEELLSDYFEVLDINLSQYDKGKITQEQLDKAKKEAWDYVITSFNNGHPDPVSYTHLTLPTISSV